MAENLKKKILEKEKAVDIICGPDAYRDLPHMLAATTEVGQAEGKLAAFRTTSPQIQIVRTYYRYFFVSLI